jgi:hypothetical protein
VPTRESQIYCSGRCRLIAFRKRKAEREGVSGQADANSRYLRCMGCGKVSLPGNFKRAHYAVARLPGGGAKWSDAELTRDELELLRSAADRAETQLARTLGEPTAKSRGELAAENEELRTALAALNKLVREQNRR